MLVTLIDKFEREASKAMCNPTAISLFSGAGGCSLGFQQATYDIRFAMDIDADAVDSYQTNFIETPCGTADIVTTPISCCNAPNLSLGNLTFCLANSPYAKDLAACDVKASEDFATRCCDITCDYSKALCLEWFVMENVEGLLTNAGGSHIHDAVAAFLEAGYAVNVEKVYAQGYGVPQRRKRVLIVGNRLGHDFIFPEPVTRFSGNIFRKGEITFSTAVGDLPPATENLNEAVAFRKRPQNELQAYLRGKAQSVTDHNSHTLSKIQLDRVQNLCAGQTMKDLPVHLQHESFRRRAFRRVMDGTPVEKRGGAPSGLKRLFGNEPSLTITSAATREFVHPTEDRLLTLRECARLQTFPDWFEFAGSAASRIQQIGNAIPPMLARAVGEHIVEEYGFGLKYNGTRYPSLRFCLTRSEGMSPALSQTESLLSELVNGKNGRLALLERANQ